MQIVVIDDNRDQFDPMLTQLNADYTTCVIKLFKSATEGLNYVLDSIQKKTIVILDYDLGALEPNGTEILKKIREKTSLIYVLMITANNLDNIPRQELIEYINNDVFAFVPRTSSYSVIQPYIEKAIHSLDARVDCVLEQWILKHEQPQRDKPYLQTSEGKTLSLSDILNEIRNQSELGKSYERNILMLAIDLLTRNKETLNG